MDAEAARDRLDAERTRLEALKVDMDAEALHNESETASLGEHTNSDQHQADVGTETFNRERDMSILEQVEAELLDVERSLRRIDDGTYGRCEACGESIDEERLAAVPAARFCLADQATAEREVRAGSSE